KNNRYRKECCPHGYAFRCEWSASNPPRLGLYSNPAAEPSCNGNKYVKSSRSPKQSRRDCPTWLRLSETQVSPHRWFGFFLGLLLAWTNKGKAGTSEAGAA